MTNAPLVAPSRPRVPAAQAAVYIPSPLHPIATELALKTFKKVYFSDTPPDVALPEADGIVLRQGSISADALRTAERCAAITRTGVGYDTVPVDACKELGVGVSILPGVNADTVAELTLTLALALLRRIKEIDALLSQGKMIKSIDYLGHTLHGKTLGLVGMGAIARSVALLFWNAFKTPLHVYSPTSPPDRWSDIPHTRHASLDTFLPVLDVLSLHCPLTPSTRNLISDAELALMKPSAILVNTARGNIVEEAALERALREDRLAGAGIDVWAVEPLVDFANYKGLMTTDKNVICLPHIGSSTEEMTVQTCVAGVENLKVYLNGGELYGRIV